MAKKNLKIIDKEAAKKLQEFLEIPDFKPTLDQIKFKADIMAKLKDNEKISLSCRKLASMSDVGKSTVHRWLQLPGFKEWLADGRNVKELGKSMLPDIIREAYQTAMQGEGTAKTNAMRMILEFFQEKPKQKTINENYNFEELSDEELAEEINKHLKDV